MISSNIECKYFIFNMTVKIIGLKVRITQKKTTTVMITMMKHILKMELEILMGT
jgi:hypothetical protein